ncbi:hypothetical protein EGM51_11650 [Verrucomicrobia bacterium S94]|nr:hypothetical protein EGM51_11650 [Verrucomicrobia bacterium S94]
MWKKLQSSEGRESGQAIIFLIMVLFIGTIVVLWNFDLHNIVSTKIRIDNAGDAAALSAARWQGITLNMIGELNLVQAAYICDELATMDPTDPNYSSDLQNLADDIEFNIAPLKRRMALIGPLMGLVAAQSSALLNLTEKDELMVEEATSRFLAQRGQDFEESGGYYMDTVQEPYTGAWEEYGAILSAVANETMIAESGNTDYFLFFNGTHILLDPDFYGAVSGGIYCYFARGSRYDLISSYSDYTSWDPLPDFAQRNTVNSEYFSSQVYEFSSGASIAAYYSSSNWHIDTLTNYYPDVDVNASTLQDQLVGYMETNPPTDAVDLDMMYQDGFNLWTSWHFFKQSSWMKDRGYSSGMYYPDSDDFPLHEGWKFKDEFNYGGANAAVDVRIASDIYTPGMQIAVGDIYWQAAAKPFGYLEDPDGSGKKRAPMYFGLVLPAFHDARLIHNQLSSRTSDNPRQPGWDEHIYQHLPQYLEKGISGIEDNDCYYCEILKMWEDDEDRNAILDWIEENLEAIENGDVCDPNYEGNPNMGRG